MTGFEMEMHKPRHRPVREIPVVVFFEFREDTSDSKRLKCNWVECDIRGSGSECLCCGGDDVGKMQIIASLNSTQQHYLIPTTALDQQHHRQ